jgi:hypothetical protein
LSGIRLRHHDSSLFASLFFGSKQFPLSHFFLSNRAVFFIMISIDSIDHFQQWCLKRALNQGTRHLKSARSRRQTIGPDSGVSGALAERSDENIKTRAMTMLEKACKLPRASRRTLCLLPPSRIFPAMNPTRYPRLPHPCIRITHEEPLKYETQDESINDEKMTCIKFQDVVKVVEVPSYRDYDETSRKKMWASRKDVKTNAQRNRLEYRADGRQWRECCEEKNMVEINGQLFHPCTANKIAYEDEQRKRKARTANRHCSKRCKCHQSSSQICGKCFELPQDAGTHVEVVGGSCRVAEKQAPSPSSPTPKQDPFWIDPSEDLLEWL